MRKFSKRILAAIVGAAMFGSSLPVLPLYAANVQETDGIQLQTIVIDNDGKDWTTESWGGATMTPNTNWTSLDVQDYYENGTLNFEVKNNSSGTAYFYIGLLSKQHGTTTQIHWTDLDGYEDICATSEWKSYSLPLKDLVDAHKDTDFSLEFLQYVAAGGLPQGTTISFRNMTISSTDDERQYPMIKVNQVGYPCSGAKSARVSYFEKFGSLNGKTWELVNAQTQNVVLSGTLENGILEQEFSGEIVHEIRFGEITEPGTYYLRIPDANLNTSACSPRDIADGMKLDTLESFTFRIGDDVYDGLLSDLTKYYYYQRQGITIEEKYAGVFARENLHPDDITVKRWSDRNNPDAETFDISGGWYDAGDYGKYTYSATCAIEDLLLAYELYPEVFDTLSMQIPETDPGHVRYVDAPGILAETKWELDMLLKLEHSSKDGSFYTAANYKDGAIYLEDTLYSSCDHNSPASERDLRCHLSTADMAGVLAHAYLIYKEFPVYADFAEECLATAQRAWGWATDPSNTKNMSIGAANRTYTFPQDDLDQSLFFAAGTLYRALSSKGADASEFEDYLLANRNTENVLECFSGAALAYNRSFLGFYHYLYQNDNADPQMTETFARYETWRDRYMAEDVWGLSMPTWGYWWGSNKYVAHSAMTFVLGDLIVNDGTPREDATARMGQHLDYLLGNNPISFSYVSGWGENCVQNIYSAIYSKDARLEPYQCPAGYLTEGTNSHNNPHLSKFIGKCYTDSDCEYTTNENIINLNSGMILLTVAYMDAYASGRVRGDVNADGVCSVTDLVLLQQWLLGVKDTVLPDWKAGDLSEDGLLDVFDLAMLKRLLLLQK